MNTYRYTLDDEEVTLAELFEHNPDIEDEDREAILALRPRCSLALGGGAAATFTLRCEKE